LIHWIPSYVRIEIKKKTGIKINVYGEIVEENDEGNYLLGAFKGLYDIFQNTKIQHFFHFMHVLC
jgi:hypothetical protein